MYLEEPIPAVQQALEMIREKGYVMMTPLRKDTKLLKMFEILPEGVEHVKTTGRYNMLTTKPGDKLVIELENGEGILYEIIDDLVNPLRMIMTLSKEQVNEYK